MFDFSSQRGYNHSRAAKGDVVPRFKPCSPPRWPQGSQRKELAAEHFREVIRLQGERGGRGVGADQYTADWYAPMPGRDPLNTLGGPEAARVVRGADGCTSDLGGLRPSGRSSQPVNYVWDNIGFRCVSPAEAEPAGQAASLGTAAADPAGIEFVRIPAGDGVAEFEIGKYEVTRRREGLLRLGRWSPADSGGMGAGGSGRSSAGEGDSGSLVFPPPMQT